MFVISCSEIGRGLRLCSLVSSCSHLASPDVLDDGSCILLWKLAVVLIVQMVVEVAILNQDFVEVLVDLEDVEIGFATRLGGAPLLLCLLCW